jgi:hypothetical protein
MTQLDIDSLVQMVLRRLYTDVRVRIARESRRANDVRRRRGEAVHPTTTNGEHLRGDIVKMFGLDAANYKVWQAICGAYRTIEKNHPEKKEEAHNLLVRAVDEGYRPHAVLATVQAWARGESPGRRHLVPGKPAEVKVLLPAPDPKAADNQEQQIRRMISMLETMASGLASMPHINPAMSVETATSLLAETTRALKQVGGLRLRLSSHIERTKS